MWKSIISYMIRRNVIFSMRLSGLASRNCQADEELSRELTNRDHQVDGPERLNPSDVRNTVYPDEQVLRHMLL